MTKHALLETANLSQGKHTVSSYLARSSGPMPDMGQVTGHRNGGWVGATPAGKRDRIGPPTGGAALDSSSSSTAAARPPGHFSPACRSSRYVAHAAAEGDCNPRPAAVCSAGLWWDPPKRVKRYLQTWSAAPASLALEYDLEKACGRMGGSGGGRAGKGMTGGGGIS